MRVVRLGLLAGIMALSLGVLSFGRTASAAGPSTCTGIFSGNVTSGPDTGFVLQGQITLPAGQHRVLVALLRQSDGSIVPVTGSENGVEIHLEFYLRTGIVIGSGMMPSSGGACTGNFGGSFAGPRLQDRGDWGIIWGS